jgi:NADPH:quinone reductase
MRAVQALRYGGPEVLAVTELADPVAGPGEVVVGTEVAPVLRLDTQLRQGWGRDWFPLTPPYVPGSGVAGRVVSVGPDVDPAWVGRTVVADQPGGYAERVAVPVGALIRVPDGLSVRDAAALLHDGRTAVHLAKVVGVRPGEWVLITGAGGALGLLLVQLAHAAGGRVIAAGRDGRKLDMARALNAKRTVDYSAPDWPAEVRAMTGGHGVDVVFDGVGGRLGATALDLTVPNGRFSAHGLAAGDTTPLDTEGASRRGITVFGMDHVTLSGTPVAAEATATAMADAVAGRIRPVIGQTFPLERAADAHTAIEERTALGKTLLLV